MASSARRRERSWACETGLLAITALDVVTHKLPLVDEALPEQPIRQWALSFPFQRRFPFASHPQLMRRVLGIVHLTISVRLL